MVESYAAKGGTFSGKGFYVSIEDTDVTLPECFEAQGREVKSGLDFRNAFHLWGGVTADFFVPCGGRPSSVTIDNVDSLFDASGQCRFKYIVEGANLFITEGARNVLQNRGVPLFKDASTNKGGVTSSSLEVLAGLSMSEDDLAINMSVSADGDVPAFYEEYVKGICAKVEDNATNEFNMIWEGLSAEGNTKKGTELTDEISEAMNGLNDMIGDSDLFDNELLRERVLKKHIPASLFDQHGYASVCERIPDNYQRAIFSMALAADFVYTHGAEADSFAFYEYMKTLEKAE